MSELIHKLSKHFAGLYGDPPLVVRAPGRINVIGEHTDYNEGFVLPGAIDRGITFLVSPREDCVFSIYAADMDQHIEWNQGEKPDTDANWVLYVYGVLEILREKGYDVRGFNCVMGGNIPIGSGLSSSAALECGIGYCVKELFALEMSPWQLALYCQEAEHQYVGVKCGIMDQFASVHGKASHVMRLDCRSLEFEYVPVKLNGYTWVLCNTQVSHSLADTGYNTRRAQCEEGVALLQQKGENISSLRDVTQDMLKLYKPSLDEVVFRRCHFILNENERVLAACKALQSGELLTLGRLMYASHDGLQHEYEVSCPELDFLVDLTREDERVLGSRMVGGGFGGCTLNLIENDYQESFTEKMQQAYFEAFQINLPIYFVSLDNGVGVESKMLL